MFLKNCFRSSLYLAGFLAISATGHAMYSTKDALEAHVGDINTIVVGGARARPGTTWIVSGPNCITINKDAQEKPDFNADAFSPNLSKQIPILFEVFGPTGKGAGKIKRIVYEHVGTGIDVNQPEPFIALNSLLAPGGEFEYLSFWSHFSLTHKNNALVLDLGETPESIAHKEYLNQCLRFKTSYSVTTPNGDNETLRQANTLNDEIQQDLKEIVHAIGAHPFKFDSIVQGKKNTDDQANLEYALKSTKSSMTAAEWIEKVKTMRTKEQTLKKLLNSTEYKNSSMTIKYTGLDKQILDHFTGTTIPYVIDLERDRKFFCQDSLLESNPKFFKEGLGLQNIAVSFHQKAKNASPVCFGVKGSKPL